MKTIHIKYTLAACLLAFASQTVSAQTALRSSYFAENSMYSHELNPAFAPNRDYFSLPLLGGINATTNANVGINSFLFPKDGKLLTGLHPDITADQFLGGLKSSNRIGADVNVSLLSVGFRAFKGYNTIGINMRSHNYTNVPKGLFEFLKKGSADHAYNVGNLGLKSDTYIEIALGHQHKINKDLTVGGKLKILLGGAHADAYINNMTIEMSNDKWRIAADGSMNLAAGGIEMPRKMDKKGTGEVYDFNNIGSPKFKVSGAGAAFDLGVNYKIRAVEGLEVSAAILDLGFIRWNNNNNGQMDKTWEFDGFDMSSGSPSMDDQFKDLGDELSDFMSFRPTDKTSNTTALGATLNIGACYALPMYKRLRFGFLSSTRINGINSWSEGRFSANINPIGGFDFTINYAISTFGSSLGLLLNYSTKGFSIFAGTDHMIGKLTKQQIPISGRSNFALGIAFPLGKKETRE